MASSSPPPPPSPSPAAKFVPRWEFDLAWVIREYKATGLRDAAEASDPAVLPMLNRPSPISSRPLWSMRAAAAPLAAAGNGPSGRPIGANNPHLGFSTPRAAAMAAGAPGTSQDMEVSLGFDPLPLHSTPLAREPTPVVLLVWRRLLAIERGSLLLLRRQ
jgi:hypothetical protein